MAKVTHHPQYRLFLHRTKIPGWPDRVTLCLRTKLNGKAVDMKKLFSCYETPISVQEALETCGIVRSELLAADKDNLFFVSDDDE